jgi:16S rRNA U516 pseudouridylate synthase RsuA-like enzyme
MTFTTQLEESSEGFMEIDSTLNQSGILYFKPAGELTQKEIKELDNTEIEVEGKTLSQKLRAVLYVLNKQEGGDFQEFYNTTMRSVIEHFKGKIND